LICLNSCVLIKFIKQENKQEKETDALGSWRRDLPAGTELLTGELAQLESPAHCCAPASTISGCRS
jgi:hypothetical protein